MDLDQLPLRSVSRSQWIHHLLDLHPRQVDQYHQASIHVHFIAILSLPAQIVIESKVPERFPFVRVIDNLLLSSPGSHMLVLRSKT